VIQRGEDLTFSAKTIEDLVGVHPALDQFDRNCLIKFAVGSNGTIHGTHASAPDLFLETVDTYRASDHGRLAVVVDFVHL